MLRIFCWPGLSGSKSRFPRGWNQPNQSTSFWTKNWQKLVQNTTQFLIPVKSASRPATPVRNSICSRLWGSARYPPACFKKSLASGNMLRLNDLLTHRFLFSISISPVRKQYLRQSRWTWSPLQGRCLLSKLGMKNNLHGGHSPIPQDTLPLPLRIKETITHHIQLHQ